MTRTAKDVLHKSVVVVAHPDDEILWFSSILADAGEIVVCFLDVPANDKWSAGRARSLAEYPLQKLVRLDLTEADVFWNTDWEHPVETEYGMAIAQRGDSEDLYKSNFLKLKVQLAEQLVGARNVFTHNPWGEYGNAEHVQVYRAIKVLQQQLGFNLWVTSYFSNKSSALMLKSIAALDGDHVTLRTDTKLAAHIADLYKDNTCWTWYDDYRWPASETFYLVTTSEEGELRPGSIRSLQLIHVDTTPMTEAKFSVYQRVRKIIRRLINTLGRNRSADRCLYP